MTEHDATARRTDRRRWAALGALAFGVALGACAEPSADVDPDELMVLGLGGQPTLEIGMMDGPEEYTFGAVSSVLRLPDGALAVADAATNRVSVFDASGELVRSLGGEGEGPGEFRGLSRLFLIDDSIAAFDARNGRLSWFGLDGGYGHQSDPLALTNDSTFSLDTWLYGRYWVEGALHQADRARVRRVLDALPPPRSAPGYRVVRMVDGGALWIREPAGGGGRRWTVLDADGRLQGVAETPARLTVLGVDEAGVFGRWRGENDVDFVRTYDLVPTDRVEAAPAWMAGEAAAASTEPPPDADEFREMIVGSIRSMARAQEIHYSTAMSYTTDLDALGENWERPEEVTVDVIDAGPRGWTAVFGHPRLDYVCGLGYGFTLPPGWVPGMVVCAPDPAEGGA